MRVSGPNCAKKELLPSVADWGYDTSCMIISYRGHHLYGPDLEVGVLNYQPEQPDVFGGMLSTKYYLPRGPAMEVDRTFDIFGWGLLGCVDLAGLAPIEELSALVGEEGWEVVLNGPET